MSRDPQVRRERARRSLAILGLVVVTAVALTCGSTRGSEPVGAARDYEDVSRMRGAEVYAQNCDKCHPDGEAGVGPGLNDKPLPRFLVHLQVRTGLGVMPSFSEKRIDELALDELLDYVAALRANRR